MNITERALNDRGWTLGKTIAAFTQKMGDDPIPIVYDAPEREYNNTRRLYTISVCNICNTPGCWNVHIDNDRSETIANADVRAFEQIEELICILNKNYNEDMSF